MDLTPEQHAEAQRLFEALQQPFLDEARRLAELLASKPDRQLLGPTEFEVRDRVHQIGAKALAAAPDERKKGGTKGRLDLPAVPGGGQVPALASEGRPQRRGPVVLAARLLLLPTPRAR